MSLRSTWVRIRSLAPDSPLHAVLAEADEKYEVSHARNEVEDALSQFRGGGSR